MEIVLKDDVFSVGESRRRRYEKLKRTKKRN